MPRKPRPPVTPPPPTPGPSGIPMPTTVPSGFSLLLAEDFNTNVPLGSFPAYPGAVLGGKWSSYPVSPDTSGAGRYRSDKVLSVHDSMLDMWLHTENGVICVAAPRPYPGLDRMTYGRVETCFYADKLPGFYTAWLLWPTSEVWPRDGEIDFPEGGLQYTMKAFMHRMNGTSSGDQNYYDSGVYHGAWHTAVIEWLPTSCTFLLDGVVVGRATDRIPSTQMRWVAQTETAPGSPPASNVQGHVLIDWVRILPYTAV